MTLTPPTSHFSLPSGWSANAVSGTTAPNAGTAGLTVTGNGDKGLNLIGASTAGKGLAGVYVQGSGDEGITLNGGNGTNFQTLVIGRLKVTSAAASPTDVPQIGQLSPKFGITSGALPTQQFVSGTAALLNASQDVEVHTPVTFNSLIATVSTCKVELSPDNVTFSTLCTWTEPVGVALAGTILDVTCRVPAGWYLKLTVAQAVLGLSTYY